MDWSTGKGQYKTKSNANQGTKGYCYTAKEASLPETENQDNQWQETADTHNMRLGKPTVPFGAGVLKLDGTTPKQIIRAGAVIGNGNPKPTGLPYRFLSATPEQGS